METEKNKTQSNAAQSGAAKKNTTTEIPLVGLNDVVGFVTTIHEKALDTAALPDVAKGVGYQGASSTPFYRRLAAARLFGLVGTGGAAPTSRATDYLKPDQEDAKGKALQDAIAAIPYYTTLIEKYRGRKLNPDLICNAIAKDFNLVDAVAGTAATAFIASLKFAGLLSADQTVGSGTVISKADQQDTPLVTPTPAVNSPGTSTLSVQMVVEPGTHTYELPLDRENKRKIKLNAPLDITEKEVKRVANWINATLLIDEANEQ